MHQEFEEEKQARREEQKAFELLVSTQTKQLSHLGNIQDDDEESAVKPLTAQEIRKGEIDELHAHFEQRIAAINTSLTMDQVYCC